MNSDIMFSPDIQIYSCIQPRNPFLYYDTPPFLINIYTFIFACRWTVHCRCVILLQLAQGLGVRVPARILRPFVYCYRQDARYAMMNV